MSAGGEGAIERRVGWRERVGYTVTAGNEKNEGQELPERKKEQEAMERRGESRVTQRKECGGRSCRRRCRATWRWAKDECKSQGKSKSGVRGNSML